MKEICQQISKNRLFYAIVIIGLSAFVPIGLAIVHQQSAVAVALTYIPLRTLNAIATAFLPGRRREVTAFLRCRRMFRRWMAARKHSRSTADTASMSE